MHHPQVLQSPTVNDCLKVKIDGHAEPQLVPKLLVKVSVRELHNNLVSATIYGGMKQARYEYAKEKVIISLSTLLLFFNWTCMHVQIRSWENAGGQSQSPVQPIIPADIESRHLLKSTEYIRTSLGFIIVMGRQVTPLSDNGEKDGVFTITLKIITRFALNLIEVFFAMFNIIILSFKHNTYKQ